MTERPSASLSTELTLLTDEEFSDRWRALVGEPPAIMLPDRTEMIQLLVERMAPAQGALEAHKTTSADPAPQDGSADLSLRDKLA